jgi:hypothetical protein
MGQCVEEKAHLNVDTKKYDRGYKRIFRPEVLIEELEEIEENYKVTLEDAQRALERILSQRLHEDEWVVIDDVIKSIKETLDENK